MERLKLFAEKILLFIFSPWWGSSQKKYCLLKCPNDVIRPVCGRCRMCEICVGHSLSFRSSPAETELQQFLSLTGKGGRIFAERPLSQIKEALY